MREERWPRIGVLVGALVALVGLAPVASGQAPRQFTLATVNNMNHLPEFVGVEKGIFVKHGVDLKLKVLNSGAEVMRAFQGGDAQFLTLSPTTMAAAYNAGIRLVALVVVMGDPTRVYYDDMFAITAREGTGIRRVHVEDLTGKRVGMVLAGTGEAYLRAVLSRQKIAADRITFVNVPAPNHVSVMRAAGVDAEVTWEPYGTMILQQIPGTYVVLRGGGYVGYDLYVGSSDDFIKKNVEVMQQLVDGFAESEWYIRHHQVEAAQIATRWIEGLDPTAAQKAVTYMNFDPRFSRNTLTAADLEQRALLALGRIKQPVDFSQGLNMALVEKAMHEMPQFFADLKPVR
ncbi:MAG TPA: ABC transporter substrate-binding protein [bacterium]|nr:ABC transporter substrate-binding protein [bacterium]